MRVCVHDYKFVSLACVNIIRYQWYLPPTTLLLKVESSIQQRKSTPYTHNEGPKDFMTPDQYTDWVSVKTALNVMTAELIEIRKSKGTYQSPFANYQIFVLRIPYGLEQEAARLINQKALPQLPDIFRTQQVPRDFMLAYAPMHIRQTESTAAKKSTRQLASIISNTLFLFAEEEAAKEMISLGIARERNGKGHPEKLSVLKMRFMYDHTEQLEDGTNPLLTLNPRAMHSFMVMADTMNPFIKIICPEDVMDKYRCRVIDGPFKGVEGYFSRYENTFVVLVDVGPLGLLKSCYVPRAHVELLEEFNINDKLVRMTVDTVTRIAQHPKDPRMWFVLKCNDGVEVLAADYINCRQANAIADPDAARHTASPLFYNEADGLGVLPVIAYCPVYGPSCQVPELLGRPLYNGHVFLYATKEDALRVASASFRLSEGDDTAFVHFWFEQDLSHPEEFTPLVIPYGTIIHLAHVINIATGEIDIHKELSYVPSTKKRRKFRA